ncbi:hypothetical protein ACM45N_002596 [Cronobacter sakazakii]
MGPIEQFFSFLSTLYTPRRAAITVFMVIGITLCLIFLGPTFNYWLTPVLKPVTESYLGYIAFLTAALGVGLSVVTFSLCEKLFKWSNQAWLLLTRTRKAHVQKMEEKLAQQEADAKFVQGFLEAYPHLDNNLIGILEYLSIEGNTSFLKTAETIVFLKNQRWIFAVAQVNNHEYVYKINGLIKPYVVENFWHEINFNIEMALSSSEPAIKLILNSFASENSSNACRIEYIDFYSANAQKILNECFSFNGYKRQLRVNFKQHYKDAFERSMLKILKDEIEIEVFDANANKHNLVF